MTSSCSVVIPTHAREELLGEAIDSLLAQTLVPAEVLVVDDADRPETRELVRARAASSPVPLRYVSNEGSGASSSRNCGAAQACGDVVGFLDDDDLWEPGLLAAAAAALADQPDAAAAFVTIDRFAAAGRTLRGGLRAADVMSTNPGVSGSSIVIRRSAFGRMGGFDPDMWVSNDKDFLVRFLDAGLSYVVVPAPLVRWRTHEGERLTRASPRRIAGLRRYYERYSSRMSAADRRKLRAVILLDSRHLAEGPRSRWWGTAQGAALLGPRALARRQAVIRRMRSTADLGGP